MLSTETPDSLAAKRSNLFPFLHQIGENERLTGEEPQGLEAQYRDEDWQDIRYMDEYRRNSGWDLKARRGMKVYNCLQTMRPDDEISRIFLGYARTQIDQGINQMTEGEPDFDFEPNKPSDHMKVITWKHMIRMILSDCQYKLHQETFFRDFFVMGCGVFEVFIDYPQRTLRLPNEAYPGGYEPIIVQDHRRPKVGVRAVNPMNCWRNPNIDSTNDVPSCLRRRIITWNQMAQGFGRAKKDDGTPRYKNMDKLAKGSHAAIYYYQDGIRDLYRIYIKTFGNQSDGMALYPPPLISSMGICVLDKPLKIYEKVVNKVVERSTGLNIPGMCSLRWGIMFDKYDKNYQGTHSAYGMGLPERIEGEDTAIQGLFNQFLDNSRWSGSSVLNYKGSNADSYLDVDANRLYGGELIDGEITPMSLGIAKVTDYAETMDQMDKFVVPATGINPQQMIGDSSKTLGEFALRIRQSNRGAEQRLTRLEHEVFTPVGSLLLANALTTLTDDDYEEMTDDQVSQAKADIKAKKKPVDDYKDLNTDKPQKKFMRYIPMKGEKIREDFTVSKKRQLDYNPTYDSKGRTSNTLVHDSKMKVETSYVPLTAAYVYPSDGIDSSSLPTCIVDSKRMLADVKNQEVKNVQTTINFILQLIQLGYKGADFDKMVSVMLDFAEIDPKLIMNASTGGSETLTNVQNLVQKMKDQAKNPPQQQSSSPPPNAQAPQQMAPLPNAGNDDAASGGSGSPANALQASTPGAL